MKKQNKKHQNARSIHEKLKTKSQSDVLCISTLDMYVNRKAFGASFVD